MFFFYIKTRQDVYVHYFYSTLYKWVLNQCNKKRKIPRVTKQKGRNQHALFTDNAYIDAEYPNKSTKQLLELKYVSSRNQMLQEQYNKIKYISVS